MSVRRRFCVIRSCENYLGTTDPDQKHFQLPPDEDTYQKWKKEIEKYEPLERRQGCICKRHFAAKYLLGINQLQLRSNAIPTIFNPVRFVDVAAIKRNGPIAVLANNEKETIKQRVNINLKQPNPQMQKRCCLIKSCEYFDGTTDPRVLMTMLPQNDETYLKWKNEIEKYETLEHRNGYICRKHFADEDVLPNKNKIVLKKGAVPRIFDSVKFVDVSSIKAEGLNGNELTVLDDSQSNMSYEGDDEPNMPVEENSNVSCEKCTKSERETKYLRNKIAAMKVRYENEIERIAEKKKEMALKLKNRAQKVKNLRSQLNYSEFARKKLQIVYDGRSAKKAKLDQEDDSEDTDVTIDE